MCREGITHGEKELMHYKQLIKPLGTTALAILGTYFQSSVCAADLGASSSQPSELPLVAMEKILQVQGTPTNGVLDFEISRDDVGAVHSPLNVTFDSKFEINADAFFQPLSDGQAFLNGDMALKVEEVNPFINQLLAHGLVFQAFHQHLPMNPQIWFVHFRGTGDPLELAQALKDALNVTSTPFPQRPPSHPKTPLDPMRLKNILQADEVSVGGEGVVTAWVYRKDTITIDGVTVNPQANISTSVEFKPLGNDGTAAVVPDFSMTSEETVPVITRMLNDLGWLQGCLYNQETAEQPQLYFDHMLKTGDAYELATEIRQGLDLTDSE